MLEENSILNYFLDSWKMAIQEILTWLPAAPPAALAEEAGKLVHDYLYGSLSETEREDARRALILLVNHAPPAVRRALAEGLACAENAPHYLVHTLANDSSDIASIVLARSPVLSAAELVDCVATADAFAQSAIAHRPWVAAPVCAALAEVGVLEALIALASNPGAELLEFSIRRIIERYGHDEDLRAALLCRPNLPASIRADLACAAAISVAATMTERAGLRPEKAEGLMREARERAIVEIAAETAGETKQMVNLVAHLRRSKRLTAGLLLRALLCGNKSLFEFALCELSGLTLRRVAGLVAKARGAGFAVLYRKAGMPKRLLPAFVACLEALQKSGPPGPMSARLQGPLIDSVLRASMSVKEGELDDLNSALRRLEAEAAREEAREFQLSAVADVQKVEPVSRPMPAAPASAEKNFDIVIDLEAFEAALMAA
jgi:uncharacterized protein (DUF2336 family)